MASSLLALLDDIATIMDDVAILSKIAAKKTAGVLGDDLALNAQQVSGVSADRELPVVWAVAKGSFINKTILVPAALAISVFAPWLVTPLLMVGGAFLCYEGFEKLAHKFLHRKGSAVAHEDATHEKALLEAMSNPSVDIAALEKSKIKGAIRTDFILSAEIIAITLGTVQQSTFVTQVAVLSSIALVMTVGVYGLVAGIVKLDDAGLYLSRDIRTTTIAKIRRSFGRGILVMAPWLMKFLSVAGTAAMFLVGGGILVHGVAPLYQGLEHWATQAADIPGIGVIVGAGLPMLVNAVVGLVAGALVLAVVMLIQRIWHKKQVPTAAN